MWGQYVLTAIQVTEEVVADNELFYLNSQQVSVQRTMDSAPTALLHTCREPHLVKPTETRKRQITSLREALGLRGWPWFCFCPQRRKSLEVSGKTPWQKKSSEASLGFSSLRVVLIFHLNTCEVLSPRSIAMLGREGDKAQELERAVKHPNLGCAGVGKGFSSRWTRRGIPREGWD